MYSERFGLVNDYITIWFSKFFKLAGTGTDAVRNACAHGLVNTGLVNFSSCHFLKILTGGSGWPSLIRARRSPGGSSE